MGVFALPYAVHFVLKTAGCFLVGMTAEFAWIVLSTPTRVRLTCIFGNPGRAQLVPVFSPRPAAARIASGRLLSLATVGSRIAVGSEVPQSQELADTGVDWCTSQLLVTYPPLEFARMVTSTCLATTCSCLRPGGRSMAQ